MVGSLLTAFVLAIFVIDCQQASADDINNVSHDIAGLDYLKAGHHASKYLADKPRKRAAILKKGFSTLQLPIRWHATIVIEF